MRVKAHSWPFLGVLQLALLLVLCCTSLGFHTRISRSRKLNMPHWSTPSDESITDKLKSMKLPELKDLLKKLGGKPGNLRKVELMDTVGELLKTKAAQVRSQMKGNEEGRPEGRLRKMTPVATSDDEWEEDTSDKAASGERSYRDFNFPYGPERDTRLEDVGGSDMVLTFLGTASCIPSITRGVSCTALRFNGEIWLFDAGEASQIQIQKSRVKASKIRKIFLTHAHGDHSFGLPGLLCLMGQSTQDERGKAEDAGAPVDPIDIYGPEGTRDLVRAMVQLTYSRVVPPYRIHELKDVPFLHYRSYQPPVPVVRTRADSRFGEVSGGRDIYPDQDGLYHILDEGELSVHAAAMQHTVPCVGFVVKEKNRPGRLRVEECLEVLNRNRVALKADGMRDPNKVLAHLKAMAPGEAYTFPDGTVLRTDDVVEPPRRGRKVVIMGDTCSGKAMASLAQGATVLVHEATNAWMADYDRAKFSSYRKLERDTIQHGHSTPQMVGAFAESVGAERLVLTHFSPRYKGDDTYHSMKIMWRIEDMARKASGMWGRNAVVAAWDQMEISVRAWNGKEVEAEVTRE